MAYSQKPKFVKAERSATAEGENYAYGSTLLKGQIISKCLFGVLNFFQKTNKNTLHSSKNKFIC